MEHGARKALRGTGVPCPGQEEQRKRMEPVDSNLKPLVSEWEPGRGTVSHPRPDNFTSHCPLSLHLRAIFRQVLRDNWFHISQAQRGKACIIRAHLGSPPPCANLGDGLLSLHPVFMAFLFLFVLRKLGLLLRRRTSQTRPGQLKQRTSVLQRVSAAHQHQPRLQSPPLRYPVSLPHRHRCPVRQPRLHCHPFHPQFQLHCHPLLSLSLFHCL